MSTHGMSLYDAEDDLGLGFVDVSVELECSIEPGFPGNRFEPPENPRVELEAIHVLQIVPQDGSALPEPITPAVMDRVRAWVDRKTAVDWEEISRAVLEEMPSDEHCIEYVADCDGDDADVFRSWCWGCDEDYNQCLGDEE